MKKLVSNGAVLDNINLGSLIKEAKEAHLPTVNIKLMWMVLSHRQRQQLPKLDLSLQL